MIPAEADNEDSSFHDDEVPKGEIVNFDFPTPEDLQ
jgi:hypothetical protein